MLAAFFSLIGLLSTNARRPLRFRMPQCPKVSADERALVTLVAAGTHPLAYAYTTELAQGFLSGEMSLAARAPGRRGAEAGLTGHPFGDGDGEPIPI